MTPRHYTPAMTWCFGGRAGLATAMRFVLVWHFSPGANVSSRPGVTWTEPAQGNSALPQSCATILPQGVHQGGVEVLKSHTTLPTLPELLHPAWDPLSAPTQPWDLPPSQGVSESPVVLSSHPMVAYCADKCYQELKVKIWPGCGTF